MKIMRKGSMKFLKYCGLAAVAASLFLSTGAFAGTFGDNTGTAWPGAYDVKRLRTNPGGEPCDSSISTRACAEWANDIQKAIVDGIQTTLGTNPQGSYADVKTRLNALPTLGQANTWTQLQNFNGGATVTSPLDLLYSSVLFDRLAVDSTGALLIKATEKAPSAATAALAGAGAGNVDNGTHSYKVTFVTAGGETDAGAVSGTVTVADKTTNGKVALSSIPTGSAFVTSRKVYRTAAGNAVTGPWLLLTTIADNTTTTYTDNTADASLTTTAPSVNTAVDTRSTIANSGLVTLPAGLTVSGGNVTVDTTTLFVDAVNHRIGIGTTNPGAKLDVNGEIYVRNTLTAGDTNATLTLRGNGTGGINYAFGSGTGSHTFYNGATTALMTILNTGNVGIGTIGPTAKLTVSNGDSLPSVDSATGFLVQSASNVDEFATAGGTIVVRNTQNMNKAVTQMWFTSGALANNQLSLFGTGDNAGFQSRSQSTGAVSAIVFNPSGGNVGIGTTTIGRTLTINPGNVTSGIQLTNTNAGSSVGNGLEFIMDAGGANAYIDLNEAGSLYFRTSDVDRMQIDSAGMVGVGGAPLAGDILRLVVPGSPNISLRLGSTSAANSDVLLQNYVGDLRIRVNGDFGGGDGSIVAFFTGTGIEIGSGMNLKIPNIKSTTGARYVCVDTNGTLTSQAAACSGT